MNLSALTPYLSPEDDLAGEPLAQIKHEYVDGEVYAMAGAGEINIALSLDDLYEDVRVPAI